jgi:arylsulfatase A-like enzyme
MVSATDLVPTIADLAGVPITGPEPGALALADGRTRSLDGYSLLPYLSDPDRASARAYAFANRFAPMGPPPWTTDDRMIRDATWKLVRRNDAPDQLFRPAGLVDGDDLAADGLTAEEQEAFLRLQAALAAQLAESDYGAL